MKRKQRYLRPTVEIVNTMPETLLEKTSFANSGGHNRAGDDGNDINDAKQGFFGEEEEDTYQPWGYSATRK